jgi:hypothetical protein
MDGEFGDDVILAAQGAEGPAVQAASTEYLGRWNRLVSTTNWEKGRIICDWRAALIEAGAAAAASTDEVWSRSVGNVTPQHVGRLRRVYQRFGQVREQYAGLYWSHFQSALDWPDAEMWLEGAVQNQWSISQMQNERAKTLSLVNGDATDQPLPPDMDEDAPPIAARGLPEAISPSDAEVRDAGEDNGETAELVDSDLAKREDDDPFDAADVFADQSPPVRPFENLPPLPGDLGDAFEAFKLAIVHHRLATWQEVSRDDVLTALEALRQLVLAPA